MIRNDAPDFAAMTAGLKVLADPTRLRILWEARDGGRHIGALCEALGQPRTAMSHHLLILKVSRFVELSREGGRNYYRSTELGRRALEAAMGLAD